MRILLNKFRLIFSVLIIWTKFTLLNGDNNCKIDKIEIPLVPSRVILTFECYSGVDYNPIIPIDNGKLFILIILSICQLKHKSRRRRFAC